MKLVRRIMATDVVKVKCDVHEWMSAYLVPVTHPYVAVTDAKGGVRDRPGPSRVLHYRGLARSHGDYGATGHSS